jgi:hypothetical protein
MSKGPQPGRALALGFVARDPAALDADHETDRESDRQTVKKILSFHDLIV